MPGLAPRSRSLRTRLLLSVLVAAVLPLVLIGLWQTRSARLAGESLLKSELDSALTHISSYASRKWAFRNGQLLLLGRNDAARRVVSTSIGDPATAADSAYLATIVRELSDNFLSVVYRSADHRRRWWSIPQRSGDETGPTSAMAAQVPVVRVEIPVPDAAGSRSIGEMVAQVRLDRILPSDSSLRLPAGGVLQVVDRATHASLMPSPLSDSMLGRARFMRLGAEWIAASADVPGTPLELIVAAPTRRFVQPFEAAARHGAFAVFVVALGAILLTAYLTSRLTVSLEELAIAADAIARGELDQQVSVGGTDEVQRLAIAFNSMTANLRRTLRELSERQALAAVGEYATSLSHEIRNALTAVRVDLQRAEEVMPEGSSRPLVSRALKHLGNLEGTVSRSLRLARSGQAPRRRIDLRHVLTSVTQGASGAFAERGCVLEPFTDTIGPVWVRGDAASLEQLFLNLLLNAVQALRHGGRARVALSIDGGDACVTVIDDGEGIETEDLSRVVDPFFSTKADGTGLGLPIARQIATAHGGSLRIESSPGAGTRVEVRVPLV